MRDVISDPSDGSSYECFECGNVVVAESNPGPCSECGGSMRNRMTALE